MATPFFRGNYGSALSRVDTRPIIEAGRAQGQMYAGLGKELGGMIKEYGLNKQKRQVLTDSIEGTLDLYPEYAVRLTSSGDETSDKKNQTTLDKLAKGELGLSALEGLAGKLALMEKKDLKDQQARIASQNARLLDVNIAEKEQALKTEKELAKLKSEEREREQNALNQWRDQIHDIEAEVATGTKPQDLSGQDQWLYVNRISIKNGQMPEGGMVVPRNFRATERDLEQAFEKGEQAIKEGKLDIEIKKGQIEDEKTARMGGDYPTLTDVSEVQKTQFDKNLVTTAKRNPNGGWDIVDQKPIADAEEAGEFKELDDFPGHYVRKGDYHLYRKDDAGNLQQVGAPTSTQQMGQLQAYANSLSNKHVDWYMKAMSEGKLITKNWRGSSLPKSKWYYELKGQEDVPYNTDHEQTAARLKSIRDQLDVYFDVDLTTP
tara:strand:- start:4478 stop:5776 length:1299 start_codon:yes stop_codon:yes gene_type:complete